MFEYHSKISILLLITSTDTIKSLHLQLEVKNEILDAGSFP